MELCSALHPVRLTPLSNRSLSNRAPKRPKCFRKHSTADKLVASVVWYNSTHRVKVSTMISIYPWSENGPIKSIFRHSVGVYVEVIKPWAWIRIFNMFTFVQQGQWSMKNRICCRWYSQVSFKSLKRLSVRSSPKWPTIEYWIHRYHHHETIDITYASDFQNLLMILYPHDEAKRNSCRLWRDWSPASSCEHLNLVFPDVKNATDKSFVQCILVPADQSVQGTTHLELLDRMYRELRNWRVYH